MMIVDGLTCENCGHSPYRFVTTAPSRSGVINCFEEQNVSVSNVRGRNDSGYPNIPPG